MASKGPFEFNQQRFKNQEEFIKTGCRCATPIPNDAQIERVAKALRAYRVTGAREVESAVVNVKFTHIVNGAQGTISEQQRVDQVAILNAAFDSHGIRFVYDPTTVTQVNNSSWFRMDIDSAAERAAKTALHVDPQRNLNFYTAALDGSLLGWATFPSELAGDPAMDGVVILDAAMPGGAGAPYNLGATAVHEVGHWLGLFHTFEPRGTCDVINDAVEDTVAHRNPDFGTPAPGSVLGCDGVSPSPVKNFMNYTDDNWMDHFTEGQGIRMREQVGVFRAELIEEEPDPVGPTDTELKLRATASDTLSQTGDTRTYSLDLPADARVVLDGPGGVDFDLYVRRGSAPTTESYDLRAYSAGADESLEVSVTTPGTYFIMARSYEGAGNFSLTIELA